MKIERPQLDIRTEKENEDLKSRVEDQESIIDYITMMSGIEIPTEDKEISYEE